jgi:arsenate reductase
MAEAFLREYAGDRFEAYRAGLEPRWIHPYVWRVMTEIGITLHGQYPRPVEQYMGRVHFGHLITVCAHAEANCPSVFPGVARREHWPFEDPAAFAGSPDQRIEKFREVRDEIADRVRAWVDEQTASDAVAVAAAVALG